VVKDYRVHNSNASFTSSTGRSLCPCWEPGRILNNVIDGYINVEQTKSDYGVVIDTATMTVNEPETAKLRQVTITV
jgi:hypothetical protein